MRLEKTDKAGKTIYYNDNYYITKDEIIIFYKDKEYKFKIKQNMKNDTIKNYNNII